MKTEIQTKDLLKLINPTKDGVSYQGQKIVIDLKELKKYVEQPKQNNVFSVSQNIEENLYKNLALYIINETGKPGLITIDLNNLNIFEPGYGLFEYIKNIYNKEEKSFINIDENGDNLILIKSKNLQKLDANISLSKSEDIQYASIASIFSDTKKLDINNKTTTKGQFDWQEDDADRYSNLEYVVKKVNEIFTYSGKTKHSKENSHSTEFYKLMEIANKELIASDKFKLALLDLNNDSLNELLNSTYEKDNGIFSIDFSTPLFQDKILEQIKNNQFELFEKVFDSYLLKERNYNYSKYKKEILPITIDFGLMINQPQTIEHLLNKHYYSSSGISSNNDSCSIVSAYRFLNENKKREPKIVEKYLSLISSQSHDGGIYLNDDLLYQIPTELFNEKYVISSVGAGINYSNLKKHLKSNNAECPNLSNKDFILSNISRMSNYRLSDWISNFVDKKDLNEDFLKKIVISKPQFLEEIEKFPSYSKFFQNMEIITAAIQSGFKVKNIRTSTIAPLLLMNHEQKHEDIKIKYLIESRNITSLNYIFKNAADIEKTKEKYNKLEYMFLKSDDYFSENPASKKALSKIKKPEEILEVLKKINSKNFGYQFTANFFYSSLSIPLKKDTQIVKSILDMGPILYSSLDEQLAYNSEIVIKCLRSSPKEVKQIPQELFANSKFALSFAKMMDENCFEKKDIPNFITKFFDNQEVTENFENYLKLHISHKDMQKDLNKPQNESAKTRKLKI